MTNDELIATAPDHIEWLIPDLLPLNELILLAAGARAGKSL
ncbi:AAA family ATPase [bacterium]|nr:AAA family ATPase [bacterium]